MSAAAAIGVTRRVVLSNKEDLTFQVAVDADAGKAAMFAVLDLLSEAGDRERLKAQLAEKRDALRVAQDQPKMMQAEIERLTRERAAIVAAHHAAYAVSGKRGPQQARGKDKTDLERYDAAIANARQAHKGALRDVPIILWEIARLEAKIAGRDEPPPPPELAEALHDIAMPDAAD